jgi:hypothetical protein
VRRVLRRRGAVWSLAAGLEEPVRVRQTGTGTGNLGAGDYNMFRACD